MGLQARDYLRVSLDRSGQGRSLDEQHEDNRRAADENGWTLGEPYRDRSVSASRYTTKRRDGYDQLVADLESGAFGADVLILWESSRGSRRVGEWVLLCDLLAEHGVHVHVTTHRRTYDPANPRDRRSLLEEAVDSEYETGKQSHRLSRQAAADAQAGKPPARPAFGHRRRVYDEHGERVWMSDEQLEAERAMVRSLYDGLFAGKTLVALAREIDAAGFRTAQGNRWGRGELRSLLLNARHAGIRYFKGERLTDGTWDPIVSEETWQAAVHLLNDPARRKNHGTARRWLGGSLYRCGQCGADMRVNYRDGSTRVYRCRTGGHNSRTADNVDEYVLETVAERLRRDDVAELLAGEGYQDRAAELRTEATGLRQRLDALGVDYADGALTAGQVRTATERIESRLSEIDAELGRIGRSDQLRYLTGADDAGLAFLKADLDVQRATIDALCTVTLLPNTTKLRWGMMRDTVDINWKA